MSIPALPRTLNQVGVPPRLDRGKHDLVAILFVRFAVSRLDRGAGGSRGTMVVIGTGGKAGSQRVVKGRVRSAAFDVKYVLRATYGPRLNLRGQSASMCRCPERDKLRSLLRAPTPHGSPPADAGALGAAEALLPFGAFVRTCQRTHGNYRARCNLSATMR
jgi:hypothetical protein